MATYVLYSKQQGKGEVDSWGKELINEDEGTNTEVDITWTIGHARNWIGIILVGNSAGL
jgi:hypothetical protein